MLVAGQELSIEEYELVVESKEGVVAAALRSNDAVVSIDTTVSPALEAEGLARDMVREIQNARRTEDLVVTDRIVVWIGCASSAAAEALHKHHNYISEQVLAMNISITSPRAGLRVHNSKINNEPFHFAIEAQLKGEA